MSSWEVNSAWRAALARKQNDLDQISRCVPELTLDQFAVEVVRDPRHAKAIESIGARVVEHDEAVATYEELLRTKWRRGKPPKSPRQDAFPQVEVSGPAESAGRFVQLLVQAACDRTLEVLHAPAARRGRRPGSVVPVETFWRAWEMALDGRSAREIADLTGKDRDLEFVNRDKAGVIKKAVDADPQVAQECLRGRLLPPNFSATPGGVKLPLRKR